MTASAIPESFKLLSEELVPGAISVSSETEFGTVLNCSVLIDFDVYAPMCFCWVNEAHAEGWHIRQDA